MCNCGLHVVLIFICYYKLLKCLFLEFLFFYCIIGYQEFNIFIIASGVSATRRISPVTSRWRNGKNPHVTITVSAKFI